MMFLNPTLLNQMNAANPDKQFGVLDADGWTGWTVVDGEDGESQATGFSDQLLVTIKINRADAEVLATFVGLVPWDDLTALDK